MDELSFILINNQQEIIDFLKKIVTALIVLFVGILLSKGVKGLFKKAAHGKLQFDNTVSTILRYVISYGISIICIIMILNVFGVNTASLITLLGAAGIAVGLALKDTLGNIASGISLLFLGSYKQGEFIEFGSYSGTVKEINLFTTILETFDGIYISAPNSSIWGSPIKNYSRNGKRRMELPVRISYADSTDIVFLMLKKISESDNRILKDPAPQIIIQSMQESHITIILRAWTLVEDYWDVHWDQIRKIREKIEEIGLKIPFPQRDIHIIQQEPVLKSGSAA